MSRRPDEDAHGVSPREREVLDRSDAGMRPARIAAEVGLRRSYVVQIIRMYSISDRNEKRWRAAAVAANARYLAAVAATGRSFA